MSFSRPDTPSALRPALSLLLLLLCPALLPAQANRLSGVWTLDRSRSLPAPPASFERQLTLVVEPARVLLEDLINNAQGMSRIVDTLTIGPETPFVLRGAGGLEAPGTRRVFWGEGGKLEIRDSVLLDGPTGPYSRMSEQSWSVTEGGSRLVVEILRKFTLFSLPIHTEYTRK